VRARSDGTVLARCRQLQHLNLEFQKFQEAFLADERCAKLYGPLMADKVRAALPADACC
jgi:hypothetical protein